MGWRTIVVNNNCKLSYKNNYLIVRSENLQQIHLSEVNMIIVENCMASITSYLLNELAKRRIKIVFCDEKHNPSCEMMPFYGSFNTSKKILNQIKWSDKIKNQAWKDIVKYKIMNQSRLLEKLEISGYEKLLEYANEVEDGDITNREGHSAKVYFNLLFGNKFVRGEENNINSALDYGYSILLSAFNREIVSKGYITPIGINHHNEFNQFNFSSDLMEVFRPLVDEIVYNNREREFDKEFKYKLINLYNSTIKISQKEQFVTNAITIYCKSVFDYLDNEKESKILNYEF